MARVNPEVERLESMIATLRRAESDRRKPPGDLPMSGCGDTSCEVATPTGMATNGGCRCNERTLRMALRWQKRRAEFLTATIHDMREAALVTEQAQREADAQRYTWDRDKVKAPDIAAEFDKFDSEVAERMTQRIGK